MRAAVRPPARTAPRPSPGRFLAEGLDPAGRTAAAGFGALALLMVGLWVLWRLVPWLGWGRGAEALVAVPLAVLLVPATGHALRRLNDLGWPGWWGWGLLVPWLRWGLLAALAVLPTSQRRRRGNSRWRIVGLGLAGVAALGLAGSLLWTSAGIAGQGMKPGLLPGDLVLVRRMPVEIARGDVLAVRLPGEDAARVARVVGMGGERVAVEDGRPVIDGVAATAEPDGAFEEVFGRQGPQGVMPVCGNGAVGLGAMCRTERLREALPDGRAYPVLDAGPRPLDRVAEVVVPEGRLFLLGDHRDASTDSRLPVALRGIGLVGMDEVLGRVDLVLASAGGRHGWDPRGWRWGRLLRGVP